MLGREGGNGAVRVKAVLRQSSPGWREACIESWQTKLAHRGEGRDRKKTVDFIEAIYA